MTWEVWSKAERLRLARYATPDAMRWFDGKINHDDLSMQPDGLFETVRAIYNALRERQALINYAPEKYHYLEPFQEIRMPAEILGDPHEGTCLDLALLFSGLCLGHNLLPVLIVLDGHALAAVSLKNRLPEWNRNRAGRDLFEGEDSQVKGLLESWQQEQCERFYQLVNREVFLPIECTGFAHSQRLGQQQPSFPESLGRQDDGTMRFERAIEAGREQLNLQEKRPFQFALDIAIAQPNIGGPYSLSREATVGAPTFWGDLVQSTVITAGGNVQITLTNGNFLSVQPEDWPDFTDLIVRSTRWFSGREFVFDAIANFLRQYQKGYFHIIADAGLGKTAIAAELTKRYRSPAYFLSTSAGRINPEQVLNALSAQLIVRYALPHTYLPARAGETSDMLYQLLKEAAAASKRHPVVVVVDALDEADPTPQGHNWLHLPGDLPEGVYVIVTQRPGEYPIGFGADLSVKELTISWDDQLHQADIEAYLLGQAERPEIRQHLAYAIPRIDREDFVTSLQKASQGNFMYLSYVLEDLAQRQPGSASFNPETLPTGLMGYYEQFWSKIAEAKERGAKERAAWLEWRDLYRPVIMLLGAAGEPVTPQWLADLTRLDEDEIRERALLHWQRFLSQERRKDQQTTWRVIHQSFVDFLVSKEKEGLSKAHRCVAEYYTTDPALWKVHDSYAHRHLINHLVQAGMLAELETLIGRRDWYMSQREYDPSRHTYARNVERAIAGAEEQGLAEVPTVVGWSLLYGTVASLATDVPVEALEALALIGEINQALRYAELISDPYQQTEAYCRIGRQIKGQRVSEAREALIRAASTVQQIADIEAQEKARVAVVNALVQANELEQALEMVESIVESINPLNREVRFMTNADLMAVVAKSLIETGKIGNALDVAMQIQWETPLVEVLGVLLPALASLNDRDGLERAFIRAKHMEFNSSRAEALAMIGVAFNQVRDEKRAHAAMKQAQISIKKDEATRDNIKKVKALASLGVAFAQIGDVNSSQATLVQTMIVAKRAGEWHADERRLGQEKAEALSVVAEAFAQVGDMKSLDQALEELKQTGYGYKPAGGFQIHRYGQIYGQSPYSAFVTVASALARVGEVDRAMAIAGKTYPDESRVKALVAIAITLTQMRDRDGLNQMLEVVKQNWQGRDRMKALKIVSAAFARIGDQLGVANVISAAEQMHDERAKMEALAAIALDLAQLGDRDKARSLLTLVMMGAEQVEPQASLVKVLVAIVPALAQAGDREGLAHALQMVEQFKDNEFREQAIAALAPVLAQVGDRQGVKHLLDMTEQFKDIDLDLRAEALTALAPALAQVGDREGVKHTLDMVEQLLKEVDLRVQALSAEALAAIASAFVRLGDREQLTHVLVLAEHLEQRDIRILTFAALASALVQMEDQEGVAFALKVIEQFKNDEDLDAFEVLVPALVQMEDQEVVAHALEAVVQIEDEFSCSHALAALAPALVLLEDRKGVTHALRRVEQIEDDYLCAMALAALAPVFAQLGNKKALARALRKAAQMSDEALDTALPPVVSALILAGEIDRALNTLLSKRIAKSGPWKSLIAAATALAHIGHRAGLIRIQEAIEQREIEWDDREALTAGAVVLALLGKRDVAEEVLARVSSITWDAHERVNAQAAVAIALAQVGDVDRALATVENIFTSTDRGEDRRAEALTAVVAAIVSRIHLADPNTIDWLLTAFRFARDNGRKDVLNHIVTFVPIFTMLGLTSSVWRRINTVETLFRVVPSN